MKIASWNVNGIAAAQTKGLGRVIRRVDADIFCFQEIKTLCLLELPDYYQYWNPARRKGYSGTLVISRIKPIAVTLGLGDEKFDKEGRLICLEFSEVYVVNVYVPNSQGSKKRADYRSEWDEKFRDYILGLKKPVIICGDFNVARAEIDVYPENQRNQENALGFQTREREGLEKLMETGLVDAFRHLYPTRAGCYTWWSNRLNKRLENRGWRLDYFFVSEGLADRIRNSTHEIDIMGSDHCPITLTIDLAANSELPDDAGLAREWNAIDWEKAEADLFLWQQQLAKAAYARQWDRITQLQKRIAFSFGCKALAVRHVSALGTTPGIDGVKWITDAEKMRAAKSLTSRDYRAQPYRCIIIHERGKERRVQIPTARDKAMQILYAYTLEPIAESTGDRKSFAFRRGRSALDAHEYIMRMFSGKDAPTWAVVADVCGCYDHISHRWLLQNIPMAYNVLEQFLTAGSMFGGILFPTKEGISQGVTLSTILSNMALDGLQRCIYSHMYESIAEIDYRNGDMVRYCDDIIIGVKSKEDAEKVMGILNEFLAERGLALHPEKSRIVHISEGFTFLSRWYQEQGGILTASPSEKAVRSLEGKLEDLIMNFDGSQATLIKNLNRLLGGWAAYHRIADCRDDFRHIDVVTESLLAKKIRQLHPRRQWGHLISQYWYTESDGHHVFALQDNPSVRVLELKNVPSVKHRAINTNYNPFFDMDYYESLSNRRIVQKQGAQKYKAIWLRQEGKCYYCGNPMLREQEVVLVEKTLGNGYNIQNLAYVHKSCSHMEPISLTDSDGIDVLDSLAHVTETVDFESEPYERLREHFRTTEKSPLTLTFRQIERIMGDKLEERAYTDENFWYDRQPTFFQESGSSRGFQCISQTWESQGFSIMRLHLDKRRIVLKKESAAIGLKVPEKLTSQKLPEAAVHEASEFFAYLVKKYGL